MVTFIGIDWADTKHDICALSVKGEILKEFIIPDTTSGYEQLHSFLQLHAPVQILIEKPNGLIVEFLLQHGYDTQWIPPSISASHRPRRSKSDTGDAFLLANLLRLGNRDCKPILQNSQHVEELRQIVDAHSNLQREQQRLILQLRYVLKQYYPAMFDIFSRLGTKIALYFLEVYPTPQEAKQADLAELNRFFKSHRYRYMERVPQKYKRIQKMNVQTKAENGYALRVTSLVRILKVFINEVNDLQKQIEKMFLQHPDAQWWLQFPGLGKLNAARLLTRIGDNRKNFESADHLRAVAGTVPITQHSGKRKRILFRQQCSHTLRKSFFDLAMKSKPKCAWAKAYYNKQVERGHSKPRANRALANRWVGIIWKLWQTRGVYDETIHVANQQKALKKAA